MAEVMIVSSDSLREECEENTNNQQQVSMVEALVAAIRKSMVACNVEEKKDEMSMDIGWPTDVRHVTHVTFDRFNGFLGLPDELEVDIPKPVPSASAKVFGVSPESMQCSYDDKGNSVPTILLLMQEKLYSQDGLKAEGIFRINPENEKEEYVRDQLNNGVVPNDIEVHCLAALIKAWFRELPEGVLDDLSPGQVLQCTTEEECVALVGQLKPTQAALLNWAVELMADVVEKEDFNKMNARNIAMVFAPNMTQMLDPLTALMHAVQVMNLLMTLILKTLMEREEAFEESIDNFDSGYDEGEDFISEEDSDDHHGEKSPANNNSEKNDFIINHNSEERLWENDLRDRCGDEMVTDFSKHDDSDDESSEEFSTEENSSGELSRDHNSLVETHNSDRERDNSDDISRSDLSEDSTSSYEPTEDRNSEGEFAFECFDFSSGDDSGLIMEMMEKCFLIEWEKIVNKSQEITESSSLSASDEESVFI